MKTKGVTMLATLTLLGMSSAAQGQVGGFLDSYIVRVKTEKRAEFDAAAKRIAEANRRHKGDTWLASEVIFGDGETIYFTSVRENFGAVDAGYGAFMEAVAKASGGPAGMAKLFQDYGSCVSSSRTELRVRRPDLSTNAPADAAALSKLVGQSRWLSTTMVHVRPGRTGQFEAMAREVKAAIEREHPQTITLASQSAAGQHGMIYYFTALEGSLAGFDSRPPLPKLIGEEMFEKLETVSREAVSNVEMTIGRFLPELSNPPEEIAAAAPDFWRPRPKPAMTKAKPKTEAPPKPQ